MEFPVSDVVGFIGKYQWLAEFRIIDFIISDAWNDTIPTEWRVFAESLPEQDYLNILLSLTDPQQTSVGPVYDFARECSRLSLLPHALDKSSLPLKINKRDNVTLKKTYEVERNNNTVGDSA